MSSMQWSEILIDADRSTDGAQQPKMRRFKLTKLMRALVALIIILFLVSLFYYQLGYFDPGSYKDRNLVYTIVIDAGSTGSRIHVFKILHEDYDNNPKTLDVKLINEELLHKIKPGLSSYANNPDNAAQSLKPLLENAMRVIPESELEKSKITLKATAGLRLISNEIANKILNKIKSLFKIYPFKHTEEDVSIMDGKYEGIYSWLTLNYALKNFEQSKEYSTCSLDLGGGSTQVTFIPTQKETFQIIDKSDIAKFSLDEVKYEIYAKSYLGFGLMSARMNIFAVESNDQVTPSNSTEKKLKSVCMLGKLSTKWTQQSVQYTVEVPEGGASFEKCQAGVLKTIEGKILSLAELNTKEIYAFSYFYDRFNAAKLLKNADGEIRVEDIYKKAKSVCDNPNSEENSNIDINDKEYPFLCMDLTFMHSILANGYGLASDKKIYVRNQVNDMEISWALGAAFHLIHT